MEQVSLNMNTFSELTPDRFLPALEAALDTRLTPLARPFYSYINRVYEVQGEDDTAYIAKFYRPGRWSMAALADEHRFLFDCAEAEIPVVAPLPLKNGGPDALGPDALGPDALGPDASGPDALGPYAPYASGPDAPDAPLAPTLRKIGDIPFAVFPKRAGRRFDIEDAESWHRVGMLLGRLHNVGARREAPDRLRLTPAETTAKYVDQLADAVTPTYKQRYLDTCKLIVDAVAPLFEGLEFIRIHGDFHSANILNRPGEGLMVIDFDDMMTGPPAQDFWLLLPDHYPKSAPYLEMLMEGYRQFRDVDARWARLIEGLRAMRIIYFTAWCHMQREDNAFKDRFPDWGSDGFWSREIQDLRTQYANMMDAMAPVAPDYR